MFVICVHTNFHILSSCGQNKIPLCYGKGKFVPVSKQIIIKVYDGFISKATRIFNLGIIWKSVVRFTFRPLYSWRGRSLRYQLAGWAPHSMLTCPLSKFNPGRPSRNQSL